MNFTLDIDLFKKKNKKNEQHEIPFKEFHKCVFEKMTIEAIKMALKILLDDDRNPTDPVFKEILNYLTENIILKKWYVRK